MGTTDNGRLAWWIAGENQKARVSTSSPEPDSDALQFHRRSQWPQARVDWLPGLEQAPDPSVVADRAVTLPTYGLGSADPAVGSALRLRTMPSRGVSPRVILLHRHRPVDQLGLQAMPINGRPFRALRSPGLPGTETPLFRRLHHP